MVSLHWHAPTAVPTEPPPDLHGSTHRSRLALQQVLAHPEDDAAWADLAHTYAGMAAEWPEWVVSQHWYDAPVQAGLRYSRPVPWALEVGCGTGGATASLAAHLETVVATDVNDEMLALATPMPNVRYVASDVRSLPLYDASVLLLVGLNAVPHIREFNRVVALGGQLLWCTSFGPGTPLYVEPERLHTLLGPGWVG